LEKSGDRAFADAPYLKLKMLIPGFIILRVRLSGRYLDVAVLEALRLNARMRYATDGDRNGNENESHRLGNAVQSRPTLSWLITAITRARCQREGLSMRERG
jgi:hypothetical protein